MDIISYAKAGKVIKDNRKFNSDEVGIGAEGEFVTVDERIDYLENKLTGLHEEKLIEIDLKKGIFENTIINDKGFLMLGKINKESNTNNSNKDEGLVPRMTSNSSSEVSLSSSSTYSSGYPEWKAFNRIDDGEGWVTKSGSLSGWLACEFTSQKEVARYTMKASNSSYYIEMAKDWTFEGFNGTKWIVLDKQENQIFERNELKEYTLNHLAKYKKYRVNITANNGHGSYSGIQELQFYGEADLFYKKGQWESYVIDLGPDWILTKRLSINSQVSEDQMVKIMIASSNDSLIFTTYEPFNPTSIPNTRFLKIKIELESFNESTSSKEYDYLSEDNKEFSFNKDYVIQTDRIVLNTNKKVNATSIKEGYYETDFTGFNRISKVKEVF